MHGSTHVLIFSHSPWSSFIKSAVKERRFLLARSVSSSMNETQAETRAWTCSFLAISLLRMESIVLVFLVCWQIRDS
nr:hypothetical protein Iba_scaffold20542CG0010 [Ipomoea batatas]